jgi:hypothetical protein
MKIAKRANLSPKTVRNTNTEMTLLSALSGIWLLKSPKIFIVQNIKTI